MDSITSVYAPIHREGHRFVLYFAVGTLLAFIIWSPLGWIGLILTLWCGYFFRDPDRVTPTREGLVVSPADGIVCDVSDAVPPFEIGLGDQPRPRVCVFMNVFNCHVNRMPVAGEVVASVYRPGLFINASLDKASEDNERQALSVRTADGNMYAVVQIAGLVARRIVCDAAEGSTYEAGERFGIIRFGSRVDVYLPEGVTPLVIKGQTMIAGETIIADTASSEGRRDGEIR